MAYEEVEMGYNSNFEYETYIEKKVKEYLEVINYN